MSYLLMTNVWNEKDKIEDTIKMVLTFTLKPKLWIWIDDGSTDGTGKIIEQLIRKYFFDLPMRVVHMPEKKIGSLATIGKAYNYTFKKLNLRLMNFDFMSIMDVDNIIHPEYYSRISAHMKVYRKFGVLSGYHFKNQRIPMGGSKCVRWEIVQSMGDFWDPAPDSFLNIKAKALGYVVDVYRHPTYGFVGGPTSTRNRTYKGAYYAGALWAYVGGTKIGAIQRTIYRLLRRRFGTSFWKGFRENTVWRCDDDDVIRTYRSRLKNTYDWCKRSWISFVGYAHEKIDRRIFTSHRL